MKLKMVQVTQTALPVTLECDPYVCMEMTLGQEEERPLPLYWRLIDETSNVVTIGIDRVTGLLYSITVLHNAVIKELEQKEQTLSDDKVVGLPQFGLDLWQPSTDSYDVRSDFVNVHGQCHLALDSNSLYMTLFEDKLASSTVYDQRIVCQFNDKKELCGIVFVLLPPDQVKCIQQWHGLLASAGLVTRLLQ